MRKEGLIIKCWGKIWELSDIDKDGCLDQDEFAVAMWLIDQAKTGSVPPPQTLPDNLIPQVNVPQKSW